MAAKQRDSLASEFFAKNRHLLGFDNPRKALLTAVKEAVDNSLEACEEAGIVDGLIEFSADEICAFCPAGRRCAAWHSMPSAGRHSFRGQS